jgi:23S rRNA pseudouridine2605 synthase/16S rRNA pseudouridine516 synthase
MFHKPSGVVSSTSDPHEGKETIFDLLQRALPAALRRYRWHGIGRLDRNTTGLMLFTNDERLVAHVTSPRTHLPKRYVARVGGRATEAKLAQLLEGVRLDYGDARAAAATLRAPGVVSLTLTEGRYHQVKRMLGAVGLPVLELHREAIGAVALDVAPGEVRVLAADEIDHGLGFRSRAL